MKRTWIAPVALFLFLPAPGSRLPASAFLIPASAFSGRNQVSVSARPAGAATLDLALYLAELDRWSAAAARLKQRPEDATQLERDLPKCWLVTIHGERFSVSTDWLRKTLVSLEGSRWLANDYSEEIAARLDSLRAEAKALGRESGTVPADTARVKLDEILRGREFAGLGAPSRLDQFKARAGAWLGKLASRIFGRLQVPPAVSRGLIWALAITLTAVLMAWLGRWFLRRPPEEAALNLKGRIRVSRGWRDWARDALAAAARGNHREAIRLAYWAGIYRLEELGRCKVERTRTHREYLRLLAEAPGGDLRRAALEGLTWRFERVWYAREPASAADFQFVIKQLEMLECVFPSTLPTGSS
jgi:hypothetical protein